LSPDSDLVDASVDAAVASARPCEPVPSAVALPWQMLFGCEPCRWFECEADLDPRLPDEEELARLAAKLFGPKAVSKAAGEQGC
jgi:hypothetical protein